MKLPALLVSALLVIALAVASITPARAQMDTRDAIVLQNQILELRRDMQVLREQGGRGGGGSAVYRPAPAGNAGGANEITAQLLDRVNQQDDQIRQLRGRLDESENARQRQFETLNKQIGDLSFKLGQGAAPAPSNVAPPSNPPPRQLSGEPLPLAPALPVRRTPELVIQEGNAALARHDYTTSEAAARELLAGPRTPRSTDAQFLLAQSLEGRRDYGQAAVAYDDAYNRNPNGSRSQDALLGLAGSLAAINEKAASCATLNKLRAATPRPNLIPAMSAIAQRAGCR